MSLSVQAKPAEFFKDPGENFLIAFDFTDQLAEYPGTNPTLSSAVGSAVRTSKADDNSTAIVLANSTATIDGASAILRVQSGVDGADYRITCAATLSDGSILKDSVLMRVRAL